MKKNYRNLWKELGLDLELHEHLIEGVPGCSKLGSVRFPDDNGSSLIFTFHDQGVVVGHKRFIDRRAIGLYLDGRIKDAIDAVVAVFGPHTQLAFHDVFGPRKVLFDGHAQLFCAVHRHQQKEGDTQKKRGGSRVESGLGHRRRRPRRRLAPPGKPTGNGEHREDADPGP